MALSKGTKVEVTFDLADKCPFLKEAPVTATGIVLNDTGGGKSKSMSRPTIWTRYHTTEQ